MLKGEGKKILMDEYDYGIDLPIKLSGDVLATDKIIFAIKKSLYQKGKIIKKEFTDFKKEDDKFVFVLSFTEEESKLIPCGKYVYLIHQCRECELHNTIVKDGEFIVDKGDTP